MHTVTWALLAAILTANDSRNGSAPTTSPTSAPSAQVDLGPLQRLVRELREAADAAAHKAREFSQTSRPGKAALDAEQAKLQARFRQTPSEAAKTPAVLVLNLELAANRQAQDEIDDQRLVLRLHRELAQQRLKAAEAKLDLRTREATASQTLRAVGPGDLARHQSQAAEAVGILQNWQNQTAQAKADVLAAEKDVAVALARVDEWRLQWQAAKGSMQTDAAAAADAAAREWVRRRLALLEQIVSAAERRARHAQEQLAARREHVTACEQALAVAEGGVRFRRKLAQQVQDELAKKHAERTAEQAKTELAAQEQRKRAIQALREKLETDKQEAARHAANLAQCKEREWSAGLTRRLFWEAEHLAVSERMDTIDHYLELLAAIGQLDDVELRALEGRAEAEKTLTADDASIRQLGRDIERLTAKARSARALAESLDGLPEQVRKRALAALQEMRGPKLTHDQAIGMWAAAFGPATQPTTTTPVSEVSVIRRTLAPVQAERPRFPEPLAASIRQQAQALREEGLSRELRGRDIGQLRQDYERLASRPWELRKRQFELAVAQAVVLHHSRQVAGEYARAMAAAASSLRERRARELWVRREAKVTLQTLQQAGSDVGHALQLGRAGLESGAARLVRLRPLKALWGLGVFGAAVLLGHVTGLFAKRRIAALRRRIRSEWAAAWHARAAYAGLRALGEVHRVLWVVLAALLALRLLGAGANTLAHVALAPALVLAYRLLRAGAKAILSPTNRNYRLVPVGDRLARHVNRVIGAYLLFALVLASLAVARKVAGRPEDIGLLIGKTGWVGSFLFGLWLVSHRSLLLRWRPRGGAWAQTTHWALLVTVYPAFLFIATCWWTALVFRFDNLSGYLLEVLLKTLGVFAAAYTAYLFAAARLARFAHDRPPPTTEAPALTTPTGAPPAWVIRWPVILLAVVLILAYWHSTLGELVQSAAAPDAVKLVSAKAGGAVSAVKSFYLGAYDPTHRRHTGLPWRLTAGLFAVLVAWVLSRLARRVLDRLVFPRVRLELGSRQTIQTLVTYLVIGGGILIGLSKAGLNPSSLAVVSGAFVFGLTFGLQDIFRNFVGGILLHFARPVRVGDYVEVAGRRGAVVNIGARSTRIVGEDNVAVEVPNSSIVGGNVVNWTHPTPLCMLRVPVQVTRDAPVGKVRDALLEVAGKHPLASKERPPEVSFLTLTGGLMAFELLVWTRAAEASRRITSELMFQAEAALKKQGIK